MQSVGPREKKTNQRLAFLAFFFFFLARAFAFASSFASSASFSNLFSFSQPSQSKPRFGRSHL